MATPSIANRSFLGVSVVICHMLGEFATSAARVLSSEGSHLAPHLGRGVHGIPSWTFTEQATSRKPLLDKRSSFVMSDDGTDSRVTLYINRVCPFAHRAWLAALELGISFEIQEVDIHDPSGKPAWFTEIYHKALGADLSSDGKVPVIKFSDEALTESEVIVEFLDRQFGGNLSKNGVSLTPRDAMENARLRLFLSTCSKILGPWYRFLTSQDTQVRNEAHEQLLAVFRKVNEELLIEDHRRAGSASSSVGHLFRGDDVSLAEVLYGPWFAERLIVLQHFRKFEIPREPAYQRLRDWIDAMRSRTSFKESSQSESFWRNCPAYQSYADGQKLDAATRGMVRQ